MENKAQQGSFRPYFIVCTLFLIILGVGAFYWSKMPLVALFWSGFVLLVFWLVKVRRLKSGAIRGFVFGILLDFLMLFSLHALHPEEDIAGIVILSLLMSGLFFAGVGHLVQKFSGIKN